MTKFNNNLNIRHYAYTFGGNEAQFTFPDKAGNRQTIILTAAQAADLLPILTLFVRDNLYGEQASLTGRQLKHLAHIALASVEPESDYRLVADK